MRSLLEELIGAIAMNAQEGLSERKRPSDVLSIQDALYKAVERSYLLSGEQVKQILQRKSLPSGDSFEAYGFCLIKQGWSGKQRLCKVEKINENLDSRKTTSATTTTYQQSLQSKSMATTT